MKVLIIGGYGTFGFNIAERLANEVELELILAGRNLSQAKAACQKLAGKAATVTPMLVDRANFKLSVKYHSNNYRHEYQCKLDCSDGNR